MFPRPFLGSDFIFMDVNQLMWFRMLNLSASQFKAIVAKSGRSH
jgi:hypothetical protein